MQNETVNIKRIYFHYPLVYLLVISPLIINYEIVNYWILIIALIILIFVLWKYLRCMIITNDYIKIIYLIRPFNRMTKIDFDSILSTYFRITVSEITMRAIIKYSAKNKVKKITLLFTKNFELERFRMLLEMKNLEYSSNLTPIL